MTDLELNSDYKLLWFFQACTRELKTCLLLRAIDPHISILRYTFKENIVHFQWWMDATARFFNSLSTIWVVHTLVIFQYFSYILDNISKFFFTKMEQYK